MKARFEGWKHSPWKLPVTSGVLLVLAHYFGWLAPNFVAFIPMLLWLDVRRDRPAFELARGGVLFGLTGYGIGMHWIYAMLSISWLAALMYLALVILFTSGAGIALTLVGWSRRATGWTFGLLLPVCWIPFEWCRAWGDLRMTADHVGQSLASFPFLIQFDDVVGPYGVGAFLLASNGLLYDAVTRWRDARGRRAAAFLLVLLAVVLGYDGWAWTHPPAAAGSLRVGLVQPNIPLDVKHDPAEDDRQEAILAEMTRQAAREGAELVVWPESARPRLVQHWLDSPAPPAMPEVQALAVETGVTILTGAEYARIRAADSYDVYNAALVVHQDGTLDPVWTAKVYLVPFTEGIPFKSLLGPLLGGLGGGMHWLSGGFTPGPAATPLHAAGRTVGVLVCYEELYSDLSRALRRAGAEIQVVVTNDAWFGRTVFQSFLADVVRMRAIETRSSFVRVANTGISGFIDPLGRYRARTKIYLPAVEVETVPIVKAQTIYLRTGDAAAWLAIAGLGLLALRAWARRKQAPG